MSNWSQENNLCLQGIERAQSGLIHLVREGYDDKNIIASLIEVDAVSEICQGIGINPGLDLSLLTGSTDLKSFIRHVSIAQNPDLWTHCSVDDANLVVREIYDYLSIARREFVRGI